MAHSPWKLAARTLRRHPGRTVLMALALIVGVASLALTVATGEGARRAVEQSFKAMVGALDVLFVQPGGSAQRGMANLETSIATLTLEDAQAISQAVPNVAAVGAQQSELGVTVEANGRNGSSALFGSTANWMTIRGEALASGAFYSDADGAALARVAVIGADVARDFFPNGAVGQHLRVRGVDFTVVGVLGANGAGPGGISMDNLVYVPLETAQRRVFNRPSMSLISVKLANRARWQETQAAVRALIRQRHGQTGEELDDFRVSSPEAMIARMVGVDTTLRKAMLFVGVLALVIGGAVIANLMFAATISRSREIGVRRAVGASGSVVLRQFWAEAVLVAAGAAVLGGALAVAVVILGSQLMHLPLAVSWPVTLGGMAATVGIGALAGYLPARRAATLPPGVALRDAG